MPRHTTRHPISASDDQRLPAQLSSALSSFQRDPVHAAPSGELAGGSDRTARPHREPLRPLLTLDEISRILGVSGKTVRRLVGRGFPHIRFGRVLRFDPADVQRWLEARRS